MNVTNGDNCEYVIKYIDNCEYEYVTILYLVFFFDDLHDLQVFFSALDYFHRRIQKIVGALSGQLSHFQILLTWRAALTVALRALQL